MPTSKTSTTPTTEVAQHDPRDTVPHLTTLSNSSPSNRLGLATALFRDGQFEHARQELSHALAENPELAEGQLVKGLMLAGCKQYSAAVRPLRFAIQLDRDADVPYLVLARCYDETDQHQLALKTINKLLKRQPEHGPALHWQGTLLQKLNRHDEALKSWQKAGQTDRPESRFHLAAATIHRDASRWSEASTELDKAREIKPNDPEILTAKGDALHATGQIDDAAAVYRMALTQAPFHAPLYHRLARWFWLKQHKPAAIALLRTAIQMDPTLTEAHALIAEYYRSFDRVAEAEPFTISGPPESTPSGSGAA